MAISVFFKGISHFKLKVKGFLRDLLYKVKAISIFWQKKLAWECYINWTQRNLFLITKLFLATDGWTEGRKKKNTAGYVKWTFASIFNYQFVLRQTQALVNTKKTKKNKNKNKWFFLLSLVLFNFNPCFRLREPKLNPTPVLVKV